MFAMFLVDVPTRTRPRPSDPPNTLAGTPASLTNCETQQRRLCHRFSVFIRKMLSFHESLFRSCPHRRPKSHPIGFPVFFAKQPPIGALGTRVLASETAGKISMPFSPVSSFEDFLANPHKKRDFTKKKSHFCHHPRSKSQPIGIPVFFEEPPPLGALGTRVLASVTAGKVSISLAPVSGF